MVTGVDFYPLAAETNREVDVGAEVLVDALGNERRILRYVDA